MKIDHIALWCEDLERMREFYCTYFGATSNEMYHNSVKQFCSYFLSFDGSDCRIEIMTRPDIAANISELRYSVMGLAHFDIEVGTEQDVLELTERLRTDGYIISSEPRRTGDGYFESAVLDPEGNYIEMSAKR